MKKEILFALFEGTDRTQEEDLVKYYKQRTNNDASLTVEYHIEGVMKSLEDKFIENDKQETYDVLVLYENLNPLRSVSIDILDRITDLYDDLQIIFLVNRDRNNDDYLIRAYNAHIYDIIYIDDFDFDKFVDLIEHPQKKGDAKIYLDLDERISNISSNTSEQLVSEENSEEIPEEQLANIVHSLSSANEENISAIFDEIARQYNGKQMLFLIPLLSDQIKTALKSSGNSRYISFDNIINKAVEEVRKKDENEIRKKKKKVLKEKIVENDSESQENNEEKESVIKDKKKENVTTARVSTITSEKKTDKGKTKIKIVDKKEIIYNETIKEVSENGVVTIFSDASTGKSMLAWILSQSFLSRNYTVTLINIDKKNSANYYFDIGEEYKGVLNKFLKSNNFNGILNECYSPVEGLYIVTGNPNEQINISQESFVKLVDTVRNKTNIVILDCDTLDNQITKSALAQSSINIAVFDTNPYHFKVNKKSMELLITDDILNPAKTILLINNADLQSRSYSFVRKQLMLLNSGFKNVSTLRTLKNMNDILLSGEDILGNEEVDSAFREDINTIMEVMKSRQEATYPVTDVLLMNIVDIAKNMFNTIKIIFTHPFLIVLLILIVIAILCLLGKNPIEIIRSAFN
jgi:Mrp family chromosome partitioning ATPase